MNESVGSPPGGPRGNTQEFDISSNVGVAQDLASDTSFEYDCEHCPPELNRTLVRRLGQRQEYLEAKSVILAHAPPPEAEFNRDRTTDWSRYVSEIPILVRRGPFWTSPPLPPYWTALIFARRQGASHR